MNEERLVYWDLLLRGEEVDLSRLRALAAKTAVEAPEEEKAGWVLLLASVELVQTGSIADQRNLLAYLRYKFSQTDHPKRPKNFHPKDLEGAGLEKIVGIKLTWEEALISVGRTAKNEKGVDYSAQKRIEAKLKELSRKWWGELFGPLPKILEGGEENA
jgi:hypothetical protein